MIGKFQDALLAYGEAKKIAAELFKKNSLQVCVVVIAFPFLVPITYF